MERGQDAPAGRGHDPARPGQSQGRPVPCRTGSGSCARLKKVSQPFANPPPAKSYFSAKAPREIWGGLHLQTARSIFPCNAAAWKKTVCSRWFNEGLSMGFRGRRPLGLHWRIHGAACHQRSPALPALQKAALPHGLPHQHQYSGNDRAVSEREYRRSRADAF